MIIVVFILDVLVFVYRKIIFELYNLNKKLKNWELRIYVWCIFYRYMYLDSVLCCVYYVVFNFLLIFL